MRYERNRAFLKAQPFLRILTGRPSAGVGAHSQVDRQDDAL
jgi:hypothetical protein